MSRYIHNKSLRAEGPFVAINCAAIPDNMLEATYLVMRKGRLLARFKHVQVSLSRLKVALSYLMKSVRWT